VRCSVICELIDGLGGSRKEISREESEDGILTLSLKRTIVLYELKISWILFKV